MFCVHMIGFVAHTKGQARHSATIWVLWPFELQ